MKIGYAGSPEISRALLERIHKESGHTIEFVLSNPDKRRGRSGKETPNPVSSYALEHGIDLYRPESLKSQETLQPILDHQVDLLFVFAYGKILPEKLLTFAKHGAVNLHASFLPSLRGASPIQSAIMEGYTQTGWTLQKMAPKMDAGDVILQSDSIPIDETTTAGELTEKMLGKGIQLSLDFLQSPEPFLGQAVAQEESGVTYCGKIEPEWSWLDWTGDSFSLHRQIMGMNPSPVARTRLGKTMFRIFRSSPVTEGEMALIQTSESVLPGTWKLAQEGRKKRLFVKTGDGFLEILEVQPENKKRQDVHSFLNGFQPGKEDRFSTETRK